MFTPAPAHGRRAHYLFAASLFGLLGLHVGVWAVQLAPLSAGLHLGPAALGAALAAGAGYRAVYLALATIMAAGLVTLVADISAPPAAPGRLPSRQTGRAVWRIPRCRSPSR